ncbi:unnamed protein product, partial [Polarella glacialis]
MASLTQAQQSIRKTGSRELGVPGASPRSAPPNDLVGLCNIIRSQPMLALMLIFIPLGWGAHFMEMSPSRVFLLNFFAIIPLAWLIGKSTEDASAAVGQTLGGLLNATFGNIIEMLICIAGIRNDEILVVKCTLLGSILSNMLLVLGCAFLVGGCYHKTQHFSQQGAGTQCSLMAMAVFAIGLPTLYVNILKQDSEWEHMVEVSRWSSVFYLMTYVAYLYFQLGTHRALFEDENAGEEEDPPDLTPGSALVLLATPTVVTSYSTDFLIHSVRGTVDHWQVSEEFIGIIILPIIGNAAEHYTAVIVAARNKMDLALGVAAGSSCQMALLVTPFTVMVGWAMDKEMTLNFHS